MTRKIPIDAFDYYMSLGPGRSYAAVAEHYGVSKRGVTKRALQEGWQARAAALEQKAREQSDHKIVETIEAMNTRHLRMLKVVQGKALEALRAMPLRDANAAVRALDMAIRQERTVRGEPGERSGVDIEAIIRSEQRRWLMPAEPPSANTTRADSESDDAASD